MEKPTQIDYVITRDEVAAMFKVSVPTVDRWVREKRLPAPIRIGRSVRWKTSVIMQAMGVEQPAQPAPVQRTRQRPPFMGEK